MKNIIYILLVSFLLSCGMMSKKEVIDQLPTNELTKLETLFLLPYDSVMDYYDLSNDSIVNFPDLSAFTIKSLDLSHNLLDTINPLFLPKGLEKLNLSHNLYCGFILIRKNTIPYLKELDMSHNALNRIDISPPLYRINVSYNDLAIIDLNHKNIQYLDISYNSDISERVSFEPLWIDTLVRDGVADGKRLLGPMTDIVIE
ncbi:hypothetical protein [Bacteroides caecimuris]|uniref:hypothetical protein n=1 Tax=Bacteroides caecimuris TaxID=1796613 RepID=UPI002658B5B1|nr:hypothetical protein [Bacteroides caecimuris]